MMNTHLRLGTLEQAVEVAAGARRLKGDLGLPPAPSGIVVFAHGSGSSRFSHRNRFVAEYLQRAGMATLLMDLLEEGEEDDREAVFNIPLLAENLLCSIDLLQDLSDTRSLPIGFFGASTGAAAALVAAAKHPDHVYAVVSRGGRPDLAGSALSEVTIPTLLIVGGNDDDVLFLNDKAMRQLNCTKDLVVIPGATHLFPEPGALEEVARLASAWFAQYLQPKRTQASTE